MAGLAGLAAIELFDRFSLLFLVGSTLQRVGVLFSPGNLSGATKLPANFKGLPGRHIGFWNLYSVSLIYPYGSHKLF